MLFNPSFQKIGFIDKSHGVEGSLKIHLLKDSISLSEMESLFLDLKGNKVPFKLEYVNGNIIKLLGIDAPEFLVQLKNKGLYTPLIEGELEEELNDGIIGFQVQNQSGEVLGLVKEIEDIPSNPNLIIFREGKDIYLPWNEDLVLEINEKEKKITYQVVEGLLDL